MLSIIFTYHSTSFVSFSLMSVLPFNFVSEMLIVDLEFWGAVANQLLARLGRMWEGVTLPSS